MDCILTFKCTKSNYSAAFRPNPIDFDCFPHSDPLINQFDALSKSALSNCSENLEGKLTTSKRSAVAKSFASGLCSTKASS